MKKVIIIILAIVVTLGLILYFVSPKSDKAETEVEDKNFLQIIDFSIEGRISLKLDNAIYVGNNLKELENKFYDIKIQNTESGVAVYLNKLWYENYGEDYIQDEYLARICRELSNRLNMQNNTEQFEYVLYKYIKDNYIKVRQNETVEEILTDKVNLKLELEEDVVKLIIRGN
ncbi:MAG: hypothetical protein IJ272_05825 [Clostridia bacterium]|nr:hypothetical protein [Clostridia bacterium]